MTKVDLPEIPATQMFVDDVMTTEWQEFFRGIFLRIGEHEAKTNLELEDLALQSRSVPAMLFDLNLDESEPVIIPGPKGDRGDAGQMGPPGMDGESEESSPYVGFPKQEQEGELNEIIGDGTTGRVERVSHVEIEDGTAVDSIQVTAASLWNADSGGPVDDIEKGDTSGGFTLDATGSMLTIVCQHIGGSTDDHIIAILAARTHNNASGTDLCIHGVVSGTSLLLTFTNSTTGAAVDLTALVNTGTIKVAVTVLTAE